MAVRVKDILEALSKYSPEDNLIVIYWDKSHFDWDEDDEYTLTNEAWDEVCEEFEGWVDPGKEIGEWIADSVGEKAEINDSI